MQSKVFFILLLLSSSLFAQCLTENEKLKVQLSLSEINEYYEDVPNYIQCQQQNLNLEKLVCANSDYMLMFNYLSKVNIYAYENAVKYEVNHQEFNKKDMSHWGTTYNNENINKYFCFDIKQATTDLMGGESPYQFVKLGDKLYNVQKNEKDLVLTSRDGYKIYLNKNCEVLDSSKQSGEWYRQSDNFVVKIGNVKYNFTTLTPIEFENDTCSK